MPVQPMMNADQHLHRTAPSLPYFLPFQKLPRAPQAAPTGRPRTASLQLPASQGPAQAAPSRQGLRAQATTWMLLGQLQARWRRFQRLQQPCLPQVRQGSDTAATCLAVASCAPVAEQPHRAGEIKGPTAAFWLWGDCNLPETYRASQ